jgi:DNA primase RepB-like protein
MTTTPPSNIEFIAHAFVGCGLDETPWVTGFRCDPTNPPHTVWSGTPAIPMPQFVRPMHNNYCAISTFKRSDDGKLRRRRICWSGLWLILLDDIGTKVDLKALQLEPSCLVETSPGNFQSWLMLCSPERNQARAEALVGGFIASGATDPGGCNLVRYGRLPIGVNTKEKYRGKSGEPWVQRCHEWRPDRRYSTDEVAQAFGIDLSAAMQSKGVTRKGTKRSKGLKAGDGYATLLEATGLYLDELSGIEGGHRIICPWHYEHSGGDVSGTAYFEPSAENGWAGGFHCHHGHCAGRTIADLDHFIQRLLSRRAA